MNNSNAPVRPATAASKRVFARGLMGLMLLASGLVLATPALAQHTLENVSYQTLPGGEVALSLQFDSAPPTPTAFTTQDPPRIALDFANTSNAVAQRNIEVGSGSTSGVTIVSADGRTRVLIDLFRSSSYRTHVDGDTLVVNVANGSVDPSKTQNYAGNNPTKAPPPIGVAVSDIGFRRGANGGGKIIVDFTGPGAVADLQTGDGQVVVNLSRVDVPARFAKHLDVTDFATPVRSIETRPVRGGAKMMIDTEGKVEVSAFRSGNKYVLMVTPVAKPVAGTARAPGANGEGGPDYSGERVTFNFQDIPVRQVLYLIASESDFNIVVDDTVQGSITLRLQNVPWDHALDLVLRAKGLDKRKQDNVIWVAPQDQIAAREQALAEARRKRAHNAQLESVYLPLSYAKAKDIAELLTERSQSGTQGGGGTEVAASRGFLSPRGSVSFDQRTNTLLVQDTPARIAEVRQLIAKLDRPVRQVLIEARIVVATDDFARELGVKFGITGAYEDDNGNVVLSSGELGATDTMARTAVTNRRATGNALPVVIPALGDRLNVNLPTANSPAGSFALAILGADYLLDLELSAAQTEGKSEIISAPRVITANQQTAVISQGQQIAYQTITSTQGGQLPQVQFKDVTLKLEVTPTITNDERVFLNLDVHKDSLAGFYDGASGRLPIIDTRSIQTQVLVDNGATVVLGGILEINKSDGVNKIPFLGDIPVLGALFRTTNKQSSRAELLVFVTPRILNTRFQ